MKIHQLVYQIIEGLGIRHSLSYEYKKIDKNNNQNIIRITKEDYPKIPSDFQCFVCGVRFDTNMERLQHLEQEAHLSLYVTGTPNDSEV